MAEHDDLCEDKYFWVVVGHSNESFFSLVTPCNPSSSFCSFLNRSEHCTVCGSSGLF